MVVRKNMMVLSSSALIIDAWRTGPIKMFIFYYRLTAHWAIFRAQSTSSIDLCSGYWQIAVDEKYREMTVFITPQGSYKFRLMLFGLGKAPATLEWIIDSLPWGRHWNVCLCWFWRCYCLCINLCRTSPSSRVGFRVRMSGQPVATLQDMSLVMPLLQIFWYILDVSAIRSGSAKTEAVLDFQTPLSIKSIRSFLGLFFFDVL